jgi:predicted MPP superfamily phosphohydrolase
LIADLHLGQNKKQEFLSDIVNKINQIKNIDAVLIAGDFMMEPNKAEISAIYKPLSEIKYPVYAVLGNHDIEKP